MIRDIRPYVCYNVIIVIAAEGRYFCGQLVGLPLLPGNPAAGQHKGNGIAGYIII